MANPRIPEGGHRIVRLDSVYTPTPKFDFPYSLTEYPETGSLAEVGPRIQDATIVVSTRNPIRREQIAQAPHLQFIAVMAAGTDNVDLQACKERGITVCNVVGASNEAVAEHAISLYFALKRKTVELHQLTREGKAWKEKTQLMSVWSSIPTSCREEKVGIVGYGFLGKRLENICKALGMSVMIGERKGLTGSEVRAGRTEFSEMIRTCSVLILGCPLTEETRDTISGPELETMSSSALIINVARGGVVNEEALAAALRAGTIAGAATDVYAVEPATKETSVLLADDLPNIVLSPHLAWCATSSLEMLQDIVKSNVEAWVNGTPQNVVV